MIPLGEWWRLTEAAPQASLQDLVGPGGLVVLAPHPDDESLGCGGLLAQAAAAGVPCRVVLLTDGSASHPRSVAWPPDRLAALRLAEMTAALRALGHGSAVLQALGYSDGAAPTDGAPAAEAASQLIDACRAVAASALFVTWREDPHHDHQAAAAIAAQVIAHLPQLRPYAYPIWARVRPPDELIDASGLTPLRLAIDQQLPAKRQAIACHRSQHGEVVADDPSGFVLPLDFVARFLEPSELFFRIERP